MGSFKRERAEGKPFSGTHVKWNTWGGARDPACGVLDDNGLKLELQRVGIKGSLGGGL